MELSSLTSSSEGLKLFTIPSDILSLILDFLPYKSLASLRQTGYRAFLNRLFASTHHLKLGRHQNRPQNFPVDWFRSWTGLIELKLELSHIYSYDTYKGLDLSHFPSLLRTLDLTIPLALLPHIVAPFSVPTSASQAPKPSFPHLHHLVFNTSQNDDEMFLEETTKLFGCFLQTLPLATLNVSSSTWDIVIFEYLPSTITDLALDVGEMGQDCTASFEAMIEARKSIFPPHLTKLYIVSEIWPFVEHHIPASVTDLKIYDSSFSWNMALLPPHLKSLHILGYSDLPALTTDLARLLPSTLTYLNAPLFPEDSGFFQVLPRTLTSIEDYRRANFYSILASSLPPSLTYMKIFAHIQPSEWLKLPRSLKSFSPQRLVLRSSAEDFIPHLPPALTSLAVKDLSSDIMRILPCRKALQTLFLGGADDPLLSLDSLSDYSNLTFLHINHRPILSTLKLLTAPLVTLHLLLWPHDPDTFVLPSSCHLSLKSLSLGLHGENGDRFDENSIDFTPTRSVQVIELRTLKLPLSWFETLPQSLNQLLLSSFIIPTSILAHVPATCDHLEFGLDVNGFSFQSLSLLHQTTRTIVLFLYGLQTSPMLWSLKEILNSLPHYLCSLEMHPRSEGCEFILQERVLYDWKNVLLPLAWKCPFLMTLHLENVVDADGESLLEADMALVGHSLRKGLVSCEQCE